VNEGKPAREIERVAAEERADLIVMGVHGRGAVDLMVFGLQYECGDPKRRVPGARRPDTARMIAASGPRPDAARQQNSSCARAFSSSDHSRR
jgi:hypothetical protein